MSLEEKLDRLEELRQKIEASGSLEEASDLLAEFDAAVKDLIDALGSERAADAQP
jgi:hypothetical protein